MALQTENDYKIALYALYSFGAFGIGVLSGSALVNGAPSGLTAARLHCRYHSADGAVEADAVDAGGRRLWHGGTAGVLAAVMPPDLVLLQLSLAVPWPVGCRRTD